MGRLKMQRRKIERNIGKLENARTKINCKKELREKTLRLTNTLSKIKFGINVAKLYRILAFNTITVAKVFYKCLLL